MGATFSGSRLEGLPHSSQNQTTRSKYLFWYWGEVPCLPEVSGRRMLILKVRFFGTPCMPSYIAMSFKRYGTLAIWAAISKKYKQKLGVDVSHTGYSILKFSELAKIVSKTKEMQLLRKDPERHVSILKKYWGCHISWSRKFPQRPTCSISPAYIKAV